MTEPFDFDHFLAIPRLSALRLSPDGSRLVVTVSGPAADGKRMASALWAVDPTGATPPRRLTRSAKGEGDAAFLPDGSLLFTSVRPDPDARDKPDDDPPNALWLLPRDGGEAQLLIAPKAGIQGVVAARNSGTVLLAAGLFPGADDLEADEAREKARTDAGVKALLFDSFPIRFWDHWLGPREPHLLLADPPAKPGDPIGNVTDVTPETGTALVDVVADISPDGTFIVTPWKESPTGFQRETANLVVIDRRTADRRQLTTGDNWYETPKISPDGRSVAAVHTPLPTPEESPLVRIRQIDIASGEARDLTATLDAWPHDPTWSPDGNAVFFLADEDGATLPWRVDVETCAITRLATDGSYSDLCPTPDGTAIFALRARLDRPPHVVQLKATTPDQEAVEIPSVAVADDDLPGRGRVERLTASADDGTAIRSWLVLPAGTSAEKPAPLVVFVHGGPVGSWVGWHWRWNAHLLAERGYAVLMPDPAISTGYGRAFVQRGWGRWGERPFTDVIAAVDAALNRPHLDDSRTALMGGSFGGYMANWVAGHTGRFRAIVTHASLWDLRGFHGTTDHGPNWEQEFGDPYLDDRLYREGSPTAALASIRTPILVIHGELDHRVPIGEALRLWTDLQRHGVPSRFLYFPDENHWILKPQNSRLWYATVLAFLDEHVLGEAWQRPALL